MADLLRELPLTEVEGEQAVRRYGTIASSQEVLSAGGGIRTRTEVALLRILSRTRPGASHGRRAFFKVREECAARRAAGLGDDAEHPVFYEDELGRRFTGEVARDGLALEGELTHFGF